MNRRAFKQRRWLLAALGLVIFCVGVGFLAYEKFLLRAIPEYADDEQNFKYGSIGNDGATGVPYAIWLVLPKIFPEYLPGPGGYASLGFRWKPGRRQSTRPLDFRALGLVSSGLRSIVPFVTSQPIVERPTGRSNSWWRVRAIRSTYWVIRISLRPVHATPAFPAMAYCPLWKRRCICLGLIG